MSLRSIDYIIKNPRKLFLLDGGGAIISSLMLGITLVRCELFFGMPGRVLIPLAAIAVVLAAFSISCSILVRSNPKRFLYSIATTNTLYCILTACLMFRNRDALTWAGWMYFIMEICIIMTLVMLEIKAAQRVK